MLVLQNLQFSIVVAMAIAVLMVGTVIFIIFYHDSKHDELDRWVDFSFAGSSLRQVFGYYRFMAVSMLFFYVLFTCSCLLLQADGFKIFWDGKEAVFGGPISGASMNPARSFGPALAGGHWDMHAVYWIAPIVGACLAAFVYNALYGTDETA